MTETLQLNREMHGAYLIRLMCTAKELGRCDGDDQQSTELRAHLEREAQHLLECARFCFDLQATALEAEQQLHAPLTHTIRAAHTRLTIKEL